VKRGCNGRYHIDIPDIGRAARYIYNLCALDSFISTVRGYGGRSSAYKLRLMIISKRQCIGYALVVGKLTRRQCMYIYINILDNSISIVRKPATGGSSAVSAPVYLIILYRLDEGYGRIIGCA
jgi:hypothetical protein